MSSGSSAGKSSRRSTGSGKRGPQGLLTNVRFNNSLPEPPFPPKFLKYGFDYQRFAEYQPTSLEKAYKHQLLAPLDVGVPVDLISDDVYRTAENVVLDPKDAQLLLDDGGDSNKAAQRLANMQKSVPWLVRPDYISSETKAYGRAKTVADHTVLAGQQEHARDRDSQIAAIEATFEAAQAPPKHPTKRGVHAVEEYPIFPDFKLWKNLYYEALFDSDPSPTTLMVDKDEVREQLSQGLLIGRQTATGDVVAHYFLPDAETTRKRKARRDGGDDVQEGEEHQYRQVREYSWQIEEKTKGAEEQYVFMLRKKEGGFFYNEVPSNIRLAKHRGQGKFNKIMKVHHRSFEQDELDQMDIRMQALGPEPVEEEEVDAAEGVAESGALVAEQGGDAGGSASPGGDDWAIGEGDVAE